jgi:hypothetical protein
VSEQTTETYAATVDMNVLGVILNCLRWTPEIGARLSMKATDPQFRGLNQ